MNDWYWNTENAKTIICPYCGEEYEPSYEETYIGDECAECYEDGKEQEFVCDHCGKRFKMTPSLTWEYNTATIDGECTWDEYENNEW